MIKTILNIVALLFLGLYFIFGLSMLDDRITDIEIAIALFCYGFLVPDIARLLRKKK